MLPELVDDDTLILHTEVPESHPHRHGPDCEHPEIRHGDHTDYVHEGHRHASARRPLRRALTPANRHEER